MIRAEEISIRILVGCEAAYVCIQAPTYSLDVRLPGGKSPSAGLKQVAAEMRAEAARQIARAERIESAASILDTTHSQVKAAA